MKTFHKVLLMTSLLCKHGTNFCMVSLVRAIQEGNVETVSTLLTDSPDAIAQITTPIGGWGSPTPLALAIALSRHKHRAEYANVANYRTIKRMLFGICGGHEKHPYRHHTDWAGEC